MESVEIKKLSDSELKEKIANEESMLVKLRLQHSVSPIENPIRVRAQRKLVARLLTEKNARLKGIVQEAPAKKVVAEKAAAPKKTVARKAPAKKATVKTK